MDENRQCASMALLGALLGASGCSNSGPPSLNARDYNRACGSIADCVLVPGTVACCSDECLDATINQNALAAYSRANPINCASLSCMARPQQPPVFRGASRAWVGSANSSHLTAVLPTNGAEAQLLDGL